jgi:hypothetical protein
VRSAVRLTPFGRTFGIGANWPAAGAYRPAMLRRLLSAGAMLVLLAAVALPISAYVSQARDVTVYLHGSGVAVRAGGRVALLPATASPDDLLPGTRVLADPTHGPGSPRATSPAPGHGGRT